MLDHAHDDGEETVTPALPNAAGAWLQDSRGNRAIENADVMPAALVARFGRATAEQVVQYVEERMAAPRNGGFRARFAGREVRPGMERNIALWLLSQFARPGASMTRMAGAMGRNAPPGGAATMTGYGSSGGMRVAGFLGAFLPSDGLFSNSRFELGREQHGGILSAWSRSSRSPRRSPSRAAACEGSASTPASTS